MPHLITNRKKLSDLTRNASETRSHSDWETINAACYGIGGVTFIAGSIFYFPRLGDYEDIGAYLFFLGSLLYLTVTVHDMLEVRRFWREYYTPSAADTLERIAAWCYFLGTLLFTVGSLFFLSWWAWYIAGAWLFVIGSILFVVGAGVNVLQIIQAPSLLCLQLMNLTAIAFVVGSTLFIVASVPYLWTFNNDIDKEKLFNFLAWQYVAGSALFLLGGVFNYFRTYTIQRGRTAHPENYSDLNSPFMRFIRREIEERNHKGFL